MSGWSFVRVLSAAVFLTLCGGPLWAQQPQAAQQPAQADQAVEVRMEEIEIKGEVERPGVFYIIPRREVKLDLGRQTKDYMGEITEPLDAQTFEYWLRQRSMTSAE